LKHAPVSVFSILFTKTPFSDSIRKVFRYRVLFGLISRKRDCCLEVTELPVVQVSVWAGMTEENKKKLVEGMTKVLEELGIPRDAVTVIIYEAKKTNWATGGQLHSERYAKT
jgi:4-oxalocrotonate tautomerase